MSTSCPHQKTNRKNDDTKKQKLKNPSEATKEWIEKLVIGHHLCPWALPALKEGSLEIETSKALNTDELTNEIASHIKELALLEPGSKKTTVVVVPDLLRNFEEYLSFVSEMESYIYEKEFDGIIQIATFHPDYMFHGTFEDDTENFTNRSPYPTIHLLREEEVTNAIENYSDTEKIYEKNIKKMQSLGTDYLTKLLQDCKKS